MAQVAQPVLSNVNSEEERQERIFRKMLRFTSFFSFPLMLGLALVAYEFILLSVGPTWERCVPLLQILCLGGACLPLQGLYQNYIISRGRSDIYLRLVAVQIVLQIGITLMLAPYGIKFMVVGFSALNVCFTLCWHFALQIIHPLSTLSAIKDTLPFALIAAFCMFLTRLATMWTDNLILLLALRVFMAAVLYIGIMKLLHVRTLEECFNFIFKKNA